MTIEAQTVEFTYVGDGTSTVFPFPSRFLSDADIIVGLAGSQQLTGFTVLGAGDDAGGSVSFLVAPTNGVRVSLIRKPPASQLVDFINGQTILEGILDNALDKLTMITQYLLRSNVRSIRLSDFDTSTSLTPLPAVVDRANRFLAFDSNGDLALAANIDGVGVAPFASQAEAEEAVSTSTVMSPARTKQQIDARLATQAEAEAGVDNAKLMTPLRAKQLVLATSTSSGSAMSFSTRAAAIAGTITAGVDVINLSGRVTAGDNGGGQYKRLASAPGVVRSWHFTTNGATVYWELQSDPCYPKQFGAVLDGVADDTAAMQDWLDYISSFKARGEGQSGSAKVTSGTLNVGSNSDINGKNCLTILRATDPVAYLMSLDAVSNVTIRGLLVSHTGGFASATSHAVSAGSKVFTVPAGLVGPVPGKYVQLASASAPANYMIGLITAYTGTSMTLTIGTAVGAGTFADWRMDMYPDSGGNPGNVGIALSGCTDVVIEDNSISGRFYLGTESRNGTRVSIRNNRVRGYVNRGISITSYSGSDIDTLVEGNVVDGQVYGQYGINCAMVDGSSGTGLRVVNNKTKASLFQGISVGGQLYSPVVSGNDVWLTSGNGVGACILVQKVGAYYPLTANIHGNNVTIGLYGILVVDTFFTNINGNNISFCNTGVGWIGASGGEGTIVGNKFRGSVSLAVNVAAAVTNVVMVGNNVGGVGSNFNGGAGHVTTGNG